MSLKYKVLKELKSKGSTQKTTSVVKTGKKMITLKEIKELCKTLDKTAKTKGSMYIIRGRNSLKTTTIRSSDGHFVDEDPDYYENKGTDKNKFEKFYYIEILSTTNN